VFKTWIQDTALTCSTCTNDYHVEFKKSRLKVNARFFKSYDCIYTRAYYKMDERFNPPPFFIHSDETGTDYGIVKLN